MTNEALVRTWPPLERARVARERPSDAPPSWPSLSLALDAARDGEDALRRALEQGTRAERVRSGGSAPSVLALRATSGTPWRSVRVGLRAASRAGLREVRFVMTDGRREVELTPRAIPGRESQAVADALRDALLREGLGALPEGEARAPQARGAALGPPLRVRVDDAGVTVFRGATPLAAGCEREGPSDAPTLPEGAIDRARLEACRRAAGEVASGTLLEADDDVAFGRVAPVLLTLSALGPLDITTTP